MKLCFSLNDGRSDMTLFLDIHCKYGANVMQAISWHIQANTFGMVPTWHYGILRGYINC